MRNTWSPHPNIIFCSTEGIESKEHKIKKRSIGSLLGIVFKLFTSVVNETQPNIECARNKSNDAGSILRKITARADNIEARLKEIELDAQNKKLYSDIAWRAMLGHNYCEYIFFYAIKLYLAKTFFHTKKIHRVK